MSPIVFKEKGSVALTRLVQPEKADVPILLMPSAKFTVDRPVQPINALRSIPVTVAGMVNSFNPVQSANIFSDIVVIPLPRVTLVKLAQVAKT